MFCKRGFTRAFPVLKILVANWKNQTTNRDATMALELTL
jgi:hypothetical protein